MRDMLRLDTHALGERLRTQGAKQAWLAERVGVDRKTVTRWATGRVKRLDREHAVLLAEALGCAVEDLTVKDEADVLATKEEQRVAAKLIQERDLLARLAPTDDWKLAESLIRATLQPNLPLAALGRLYNLLAIAAWRQGKYDEALRHAERAREIGERAKDAKIVCGAVYNTAVVESLRGDHLAALASYERCLERPGGRDPIALGLQDEARTQRFREEENVPRARTGLRPDPLRMHQAHDREAVLRLAVANGVTSREDRTGRTHPLLGTSEHLPEHLDGKLLGKRGNRERQQRSAAHREDVVERVRRGNGTEGPRIVDEWREEVDREHDRTLVVEPVHRGVVGGIEPDEQVLRIGRNEPREQRLESCRRVLRGAPSGARERREPDRLHGDTVRKDIPPENRRLPSERSNPFSLPLTRGRRPLGGRTYVEGRTDP